MDYFYIIINYGLDKFLYIKIKIVVRNEFFDYVFVIDVIDRKKFSVVNLGYKFVCFKYYKYVLSMLFLNNLSDIKIICFMIFFIIVMYGIMKNFFKLR